LPAERRGLIAEELPRRHERVRRAVDEAVRIAAGARPVDRVRPVRGPAVRVGVEGALHQDTGEGRDRHQHQQEHH
jgi:hypothetical protein